jgi:Ser-Thr-rich glycosyl-phosphatidyl-inositol-anchored membrane family
MIRTRHVALAFALSAVATPIIAVQPASAAPALTSSVEDTLYTGSSPVFTFDADEDEDITGAYALVLYKGETRIATLATGTDVTALTTYKWTIPTGVKKLVDTDLTLQVVSTATTPAFPAVATEAFAITPSTIGAVALVDLPADDEDLPVNVTTAAAGSTHTVTWDRLGATGSKVKIDLVQTISGKDKRIPLVKETTNDEAEDITIPAAAVANATTRIEVTPSNKAATFGESADFAVTAIAAGTVKVVAANGDADDSAIDAAKNGDTITITWTNAAPVQLDLYLADATKPAAKIAKSATDGILEYTIPAKLAAGDYTVKATVVGVKPAVSADSDTIAVAQPTFTATDVSGSVTQGETVTLAWESNGSAVESTSSVSILLVAGEKATKIDAKAVTLNGDGTIEWVVPAKQAAGTSYKIRVLNNNLKQADDTYDDSAAFTITANTTVVS